ncbi:histidine kinase [Micromonospora sp. WMMD956]|uniref:sensor histidine kinase n=1 Tax=Micromonospora TaxID=1873 RepID=UPI002415FFFA|nr:histidine kinase [Micromonospora sp. WMMD956]MDG4818867.1 histidine kinase [Micromonospora sp. WMMD956]
MTADLRAVRLSTALSLGLGLLIGGVVQVLLGVGVATGPRAVALAVATAAAVLAGLATVPLLLRVHEDATPRHPLVLVLLALSGVVWALAVAPPFAGWGWAFTLAMAGGVLGCLVRGWWRAAVILGCWAVIGLGGLAGVQASSRAAAVPSRAGAGGDAVVIGTLALYTLLPLSAVWMLQVVLRLEHARRLAADLAVTRERLRFAADLHDIQGHHLQVIALKSELAERLLPGQPERAGRELAEIRRIAQVALDDTRAVVNDYRTVTVAAEARNAAAVLRSAGIRCAARVEAADLPVALGAIFAVAIREAVTNVLRHSRATEATMELVRVAAEYRLTVTNDGAGVARPDARDGTGLVGLAQRVAAQRGTVETTHEDDTFVLIVRVPTADAGGPGPGAVPDEPAPPAGRRGTRR